MLIQREKPHSLYSRSLFLSHSPLLLLLSYFLLCLGRTAADCTAVENHGGGGLWCHDVIPCSSPQHKFLMVLACEMSNPGGGIKYDMV